MTTGIVPSGYDLIICRDALQHFSFNLITDALENFSKSDSKYILLGSYDSKLNTLIKTGECFEINLLNAPFLLPAPIEIFHEKTDVIANRLGFKKEPEKLMLLYEISTLKSIDFASIRQKLSGQPKI